MFTTECSILTVFKSRTVTLCAQRKIAAAYASRSLTPSQLGKSTWFKGPPSIHRSTVQTSQARGRFEFIEPDKGGEIRLQVRTFATNLWVLSRKRFEVLPLWVLGPSKPIPRQSFLQKLNPVLDNGLIVVGGRLKNSEFENFEKIIISKDSGSHQGCRTLA